jgi:hypothetical protein
MAISRLGWHFLDNTRTLRHGNGSRVFIGKKLEWRNKYEKNDGVKINDVEICHFGMHASALIIDAESFANNYIYGGHDHDAGYLCRVKIDGTNYETRNHAKGKRTKTGHIYDYGKFVGTHRTVLGMVPVMWLIHNFGDATCWDDNKKEIIAEMNRRNQRNKNPTRAR